MAINELHAKASTNRPNSTKSSCCINSLKLLIKKNLIDIKMLCTNLVLGEQVQAVLAVDHIEYADTAESKSWLVVDEQTRRRYDATGQVGRMNRAYDRGQLNHVLPDALLRQQAQWSRAGQYGFASAERPRASVYIVRISPALQVYVRIVV